MVAAQNGVEAARRVATQQETEPWFWSSSLEGHVRLRYSFEVKMTQRRPNAARRGESPLSAWQSVRLEHLPLAWGSHQRCLEFDGRSPCPDEWNLELERQAARRQGMSAVEREGTDAGYRAVEARHAAWWRKFPESHKIEHLAPDRLRFQGEWTGELTFDPATYRIRTIQYRETNGESFRCEMIQLPDGARLPLRVELGSASRHQVFEYSKYRRFMASSVMR